MTCPRCQTENPAHAKFCLGCGVHLRSTGEGGPSGAPHAELERALTEGAEQQTATAEILRIISSSPAAAQPVFDAIASHALRLCDAEGVSSCATTAGSYRSPLTATSIPRPSPVWSDWALSLPIDAIPRAGPS